MSRESYLRAIQSVVHEPLDEPRRTVLKCEHCGRDAVEEAIYDTGSNGRNVLGIAYHCGADLCKVEAAHIAVARGHLYIGRSVVMFALYCAWDEFSALITLMRSRE